METKKNKSRIRTLLEAHEDMVKALGISVLSLLMWVFMGKVINMEFLNPVINPIEDTELTDYYFSRIQQGDTMNTSIYIIDFSRKEMNGEIAKGLEEVESYRPAVVCLDYALDSHTDNQGDSMLADAIHLHRANLVLPPGADNEQSFFHYYFSRFRQDRDSLHWGYADFENPHHTNPATVRLFSPQKIKDKCTTHSLATETIRLFNTSAYNELIDRGNSAELVSYRLIDHEKPSSKRFQVYTRIPEGVLDGKIAIIGDLASDRHFSPLNQNLGRSFPDISGSEIQAHIMATILNREYIHQLPFAPGIYWISLFAIIFFFLRLNKYLKNHPVALHISREAYIILTPFVIFIISMLSLQWFHLKIEPTEILFPFIYVLPASLGVDLCLHYIDTKSADHKFNQHE